MTDEQLPEDDSVVSPEDPVLETGTDDDEDFAAEPINATRNSPYAVAAFIVGLLGMFQAPQNGFFFGDSLRFGLLLVPTAVASITALWLARRAEDEIFKADGALGGVGFYVTGRVLGTLTLVFSALTVLLLIMDVGRRGGF